MTWYPVVEAERDGERLAVHRGPGDGPALVLAHGLEDSWHTWRPFVDELGTDLPFTPYALDLPWRAGARYGWVYRTHPATLLRHALALLPEPPALLVGHSFGANAVLELLAAADRPAPTTPARRVCHRAATWSRRLDGVVLLAPHFRPPDDPVDWRLHDRELARFRAVIGEGLRLRLGERRHTLDPDLVDTMVAKALDRVSPLAFVALLRQFLTTAELGLDAVTVPTLVVTGTLDPALAGARTEALRRAMPVASVHTRPDGGHFCHLEQAAAVTAEIRRFLAALPTPTLA
ncbi:alpha/beta hydrolase [Micromonospora sp. DR5-3]|uniref:alpha/beta fold hydrolase n=1 Tax=unclassified Micromonospora TaxID=2617518 RepID=UPI0011DBEF6B|nr:MULTISPECIES: alpha/beta hydrolase [unclassified Micromonospora]MCW3816578.1 alpha/beta hydrolase [Micromonospora sp. DR5-3]TYC20231.1 alpha/beta hydrolase [Micromonospora sp. MP36]